MRRQALRIGELWCVASWNHEGKVIKTWCESKRQADRLQKALLDNGHWESVCRPIGPFKMAAQAPRKDSEGT